MSLNSFGHLFRVATWGESHGPALGATVDGCPPGVAVDADMLQRWLDMRKPGQNRYTTQRQEPDQVEILSGVFEGKTTGTPVQLMIRNTDQRSKDYSEIAETFRPGHAGRHSAIILFHGNLHDLTDQLLQFCLLRLCIEQCRIDGPRRAIFQISRSETGDRLAQRNFDWIDHAKPGFDVKPPQCV